MFEEIWKSVPGYHPAYQVSSRGRFRSLKRGFEFIPTLRRTGRYSRYYQVHLVKMNREVTCTTLQRAVFLAFNGPIPEGMEIDHIDDDSENNRPENLQAVTRQENMAKSWARRRAAGHIAMHTLGEFCKRGHKRTPENTRVKNDGYRYCIACERVRYEMKKTGAA